MLGLAVRLVPWGMTFTSDGVRFRSDTDPYYHALRAQRTVAQWPHVPWTDDGMNAPYGAWIPWPPLFDFVIAALSRLFGATAATPEIVAKVAAWLALAVGVAILPLVAHSASASSAAGPGSMRRSSSPCSRPTSASALSAPRTSTAWSS